MKFHPFRMLFLFYLAKIYNYLKKVRTSKKSEDIIEKGVDHAMNTFNG